MPERQLFSQRKASAVYSGSKFYRLCLARSASIRHRMEKIFHMKII